MRLLFAASSHDAGELDAKLRRGQGHDKVRKTLRSGLHGTLVNYCAWCSWKWFETCFLGETWKTLLCLGDRLSVLLILHPASHMAVRSTMSLGARLCQISPRNPKKSRAVASPSIILVLTCVCGSIRRWSLCWLAFFLWYRVMSICQPSSLSLALPCLCAVCCFGAGRPRCSGRKRWPAIWRRRPSEEAPWTTPPSRSFGCSSCCRAA